MLDTLALNADQLSKLSNRLFVADYGGMTDESAKAIRKEAFRLRNDRLASLEKCADKLDKKLPSTKMAEPGLATVQLVTDTRSETVAAGAGFDSMRHTVCAANGRHRRMPGSSTHGATGGLVAEDANPGAIPNAQGSVCVL